MMMMTTPLAKEDGRPSNDRGDKVCCQPAIQPASHPTSQAMREVLVGMERVPSVFGWFFIDVEKYKSRRGKCCAALYYVKWSTTRHRQRQKWVSKEVTKQWSRLHSNDTQTICGKWYRHASEQAIITLAVSWTDRRAGCGDPSSPRFILCTLVFWVMPSRWC